MKKKSDCRCIIAIAVAVLIIGATAYAIYDCESKKNVLSEEQIIKLVNARQEEKEEFSNVCNELITCLANGRVGYAFYNNPKDFECIANGFDWKFVFSSEEGDSPKKVINEIRSGARICSDAKQIRDQELFEIHKKAGKKK